MKGDFTRDTFDAANHFRRVLMQQGRVQLDADWNEQTSILLHYLQTLAKDIIGPHAGPEDALGFDLITDGGVDAEERIDAIEPDPGRREFLKKRVEAGDVVIGTGRYYVEGVLVENHRAMLYTEQPGYPFSEETSLDNLQGKALLAYLDVWERHITPVEDDRIREAALGGPDTCTRAQLVWQVKALLRPDNLNQFDCTSLLPLLSRELPSMRARARLDKPPTELCIIPPESRYRGAENQLYRVEVHDGGTGTAAAGATFKWSRENGSVVFPIRSLTGTTVAVEHLGRDQHLGLKTGDWVEVVDDDCVMRGGAGPLAQVDTVDRDALEMTLSLPDGAPALPGYTGDDTHRRHPLLRRWDHAGNPAFSGALPIVGQAEPGTGWTELEDGVWVWFSAHGEYRPGDYWLIPARVATGNVEWPPELDTDGDPKVDADGNRLPAARPPRGPQHYYAPLFLAPGDNGDGEGIDCRCRINSMPCAGYPYAFGGTAIGGGNL